MAQVTAGNASADLVAWLFEQYQAAIFAYIWRLVGDRAWAEELVQETFLRVFDARERLPEVVNQRAWVYRIATNIAFNALRRRRRFAWLPWRSAHPPSLQEMNAAEQVGQRAAIEAALAALSPKYRAPLLLFSHYGFTLREVAEALGIGEGAVKTRLYRAREMFRRAYERES